MIDVNFQRVRPVLEVSSLLLSALYVNSRRAFFSQRPTHASTFKFAEIAHFNSVKQRVSQRSVCLTNNKQIGVGIFHHVCDIPQRGCFRLLGSTRTLANAITSFEVPKRRIATSYDLWQRQFYCVSLQGRHFPKSQRESHLRCSLYHLKYHNVSPTIRAAFNLSRWSGGFLDLRPPVIHRYPTILRQNRTFTSTF